MERTADTKIIPLYEAQNKLSWYLDFIEVLTEVVGRVNLKGITNLSTDDEVATLLEEKLVYLNNLNKKELYPIIRGIEEYIKSQKFNFLRWSVTQSDRLS